MNFLINKPFKAFMFEEQARWIEAQGSLFVTNRMIEMAMFITSLQMAEKCVGVFDTQNSCSLSRSLVSADP
jgi:hypothetical protein